MPDSKRLQVLKALTTLLETIPEYSLAGKVWRGRTRISDESEKPCLVIFEQPPEEEKRADGNTKSMPWYIAIQGFIEPDPIHPTDPAHQLMAAVKLKLSEVLDTGGAHAPGPNYMFGNLIGDLVVDGGMAFAPDDTTNCCFFGLKLTVTITETLGEIYG